MRTAGFMFCAVLAASCLWADFKVAETVDIVVLTDGTEITGTIIARGARGVILVKDAGEVIIPKEKIAKIKKGAPSSETKGFTTDPVEGQKVVTGEGFRNGGAAAGSPAQASKAGNTGKAKAATAGGGKGGRPGKGGPKGKVTADMVKNMMAKDKRVEAWVKMSGGPERAARMLSDPKARREVEALAKKMGVQLPK